MADAQIDDVLRFWFEGDQRRWFMRDPAFDAEVRDRFAALHAQATAGTLDAWAVTPRGALALVILLDQLSRNLYRDDPRAFANDGRALAIAHQQIKTGAANELAPLERMFLLMPFQHSEDLTIQREGIAEFQKLVAAAPGNGMLAAALDYAKQHAAVIERFGRFPHRNRVLGRASTPDEVEFLTQPGSSF